MTTQQQTRLTAEAFFEQYGNEEGKYELVKGEVIEMPPVGGEHGETAVNISTALRNFTSQHPIGRVTSETGYRLDDNPGTLRAPDVGFIRQTRLPGGRMTQSFIPVAPDLAIEVVSPWDSASQLHTSYIQ